MESFRHPPVPFIKHVLLRQSSFLENLLHTLSRLVRRDTRIPFSPQIAVTEFINTLCQYIVFLLLLRTGDDEATTERKVALLLQTANKVKWKTAENEEEEEKV